MLRRLSDVAISSIDKLLNFGENDRKRSKKNLKNESQGHLRRSKGLWNLTPDHCDRKELSDSELNCEFSGDELSSCTDFSDLDFTKYEDNDEEYQKDQNCNSQDQSVLERFEDLDVRGCNVNLNAHQKIISIPEHFLPNRIKILSTEHKLDVNRYEKQLERFITINPLERSFILWNCDTFPKLSLSIEEIQYWNDFYYNMRVKEMNYFTSALLRFSSKSSSKESNGGITNNLMRAKLLNWLFEVSLHFKFSRATIYQTQMIMDTFISITNSSCYKSSIFVSKENIQLIGVASLLIATKMEEIRPPNLLELSHLTDYAFSENQIAEYELLICSTLSWNLTLTPTMYAWIELYMKLFVKLFKELDGYDLDLQKQNMMRLSDLILHTSTHLTSFKLSALSAAIFFTFIDDVEEASGLFDQNILLLCTGYKYDELKKEIAFINNYTSCPDSIAYYDTKLSLNDDQFDKLLDTGRRALQYILKKEKENIVIK